VTRPAQPAGKQPVLRLGQAGVRPLREVRKSAGGDCTGRPCALESPVTAC